MKQLAGVWKSIAFVLATILIFVCVTIIFCFNDKEYTITITEKERIIEAVEESVSSKYLVFGEDENGKVLVFENTDNLLRGKWNSSTVQGSLKVGKTYTIVAVGYRIPFFSCYEKIIYFEEEEK